MQLLRTGLAVAVCSILLGACFLTAETSPLPTASFGEAENEVGNTGSAEEKDREVFDRLVKLVNCNERAITMMEKTAECPYRTLSFDGVTHVVCDYPQCRDPALCKERCVQAIAYLKPNTHIAKEEPEGKCQKVYNGCIYEGKNGRQSTEPPPTV